MSSIATFYILPEGKRTEFSDAHRNQKRVTSKRTLFGQKQVVTGNRFLWEYLDAANSERTDFPFSGFALIDYFFAFLTRTLPKHMESALAGAAVDENHYVFSTELAATFREYLRQHPPDSAGLLGFAARHNPTGGTEYVQMLRETHDFLVRWFSRITPGTFGVLHITI